MRKWINIAESIILVAMLVFVIGFHKIYKQPIYIENRYNQIGATWNGKKLASPENQHATFIENRWHAVGFDRDGNLIIPKILSVQSPLDVLSEFDPDLATYNWGEEWHKNQLNYPKTINPTYYFEKYDAFSNFITDANKYSTIHLFNNSIKGTPSINIGDIAIIWEEIDKDKLNSKPVQEIIKTENNPKDNDLFPEMYFYIEQPNGNTVRFKIYRGLSKGEGAASFRFLTKSVFPSAESMKVTVR